MENRNKFLEFIEKYKGAIIGAIIAIVLIATSLYKLLVALIVICVCIYGGNYIQQNKENVKDKVKEFIDKF